MRAPPPARVHIQPPPAWRWARTAFMAAAAASGAAWLTSHLAAHGAFGPGWPSAWVAGLAVLAVFGWQWRQAPTVPVAEVVLEWNGSAWLLAPGTAQERTLGAVAVIWDWGRFLLLRLQPSGGGSALWVPWALGQHPADDAASERALCAALYSHGAQAAHAKNNAAWPGA
jgi:hypothetical protein